jgi:hypothetical protein
MFQSVITETEKQWSAFYVGGNERNPRTRLMNNVSQDAWENLLILEQEPDWFKRVVKEARHIRIVKTPP